jgi:single-strand DNA-binding protein
MTYQSVSIIGNLGRDPEMRVTPAGQNVTSFSVATNRTWTSGAGEKMEEVTWFRVTCWGKLAETTNQYIRKGSKVLVVGRLSPDKNGGPRVWNNAEGVASASYELTAETVRFLSTRGDNGVHEDAPSASTEDDIPF